MPALDASYEAAQLRKAMKVRTRLCASALPPPRPHAPTCPETDTYKGVRGVGGGGGFVRVHARKRACKRARKRVRVRAPACPRNGCQWLIVAVRVALNPSRAALWQA